MDTVLVFGGSTTPFALQGATRPLGEGELRVTLPSGTGGRGELALLFETDPTRTVRRLAARPVDLVVLDARGPSAAATAAMLEILFPVHSVGGPARRARTLVLVDADGGGAEIAFAAGLKHVGRVMVAPSETEVLATVLAMLERGERTKVAVCLAGGGIEGLLYEVGVLRALDHFFEDRSVCDLDFFCGISAGAILAGLLANGLTPREIAEGLRHGHSRLDRMTRRDLFDPNVGELGQRLLGFARDVVGLGAARNPVSALYRALPSAVFAGDALREYLRRQFAKPGMSDSFDGLRRPLYIGATDQDTSEAVVFGEGEHADVPLHRAIRASCALAPFYAPEQVDGRFYTDGGFTRTTNMRVAARRGATMVILIDPLVPIRSDVPGYVHTRGGLFGTMQGLKCLINGRFDKAVASIREMYPEVAFHLFRPEGDEMRILSGSPMKFLYREEVEELAYQRTLRKIRAHFPDISRDFERHGIAFREPPAPQPSGRRSIDLLDSLVAA